MSSISSIDDLLSGIVNPQITPPPESIKRNDESHEDIDVEYESDDSEKDIPEESDDFLEEKDTETPAQEDEAEEDEYGNQKERLPKGLKDRLDRKEKQHQEEVSRRDYEIQQLRQQLQKDGASSQVQEAVKDFQYDASEEGDWQHQLTSFVEQTVVKMQSKHQTQQKKAIEADSERKFGEKLHQGKQKFVDFVEVVNKLPIDDDMTRALMGMNDPAAFIYAAGKRQPGEIERISKLPDPYTRMVEMVKLEERMRKNKPTTQAPRPLGRMKEDSTQRVTPKQKDSSGDDLLARADAKRIAMVKNRHRSNR